ncbi:MAG: sigma-70 family RNA polymerase sigma factor [Candidatus Sulfotelmatobacter sp.]
MKITTTREVSMNCKQKFTADKQDCLSSNRSATEIDTNGSAQTIPLRHSQAIEEIWRTHAKKILCITQRITNNREDAEDALQDSFLRAHVHLHDFDGRSSIGTWLTRIAINSALMILRKRTGAAQVSIDNVGAPGTVALALIPVTQTPSPEAQYADLEVQAMVRSAIGTLRPSIRRALELQTLEERSVKEIADSMSLSVAAVKSRNFHARSALRESLQTKLSRRSGATRGLQPSAV